MQCMKCGRETQSGQVFCSECLADMENHPVKPGTVVQLPPRETKAQVKKPAGHHRKPAVPPEETIRQLRKRVAVLSVTLALVLTAFACLTYVAVSRIFSKDTGTLPGQNYSSRVTVPGETQ